VNEAPVAVPRDDGQSLLPAGEAFPSLGLLLRKAREARGLGIHDVVQSLKFSQRQIEALEADELGALPGSVFVRGFVRSYARFLQLDPEPLLGLIADSTAAETPEVRPPDNMGTAMPAGGVRQVPTLVVVSALLLVVAAAMVGWHFLGGKLVPESVTMRSAVPTDSAPMATASSAPESATRATTANMDAVAAPPGAEPEVRPDSDPMNATAAGEPVVPAAQAAADARQLVFSFHGKSWVEVKDASQQIIFTGQFGAGARQVVTGQPPLQVVVGNAAAVELQFGERLVDLKPYTRAEVARLTLEP
jgi:cytoskeleton protein RodZ